MPGIDRHSRIVGWLKVALPLAGLALLSTLFLLADRVDPSDAIPYATVDVEDLARDPRMTGPAYAGTTEDGTAISVTAKAARPANGTRTAEASDVTARLAMPGGGSAEILAGSARVETAADRLVLGDDVRIETSAGYRITAPGLTVSLDRSGMASEGAVSAEGPPGQIEAGAFTLEQTTGIGGETGYLLVFSGRVKLLYQPGG